MVKIEKLNAATAVYTRNGVEQPVFLNAILTDEDFKTFKVLKGSVVVSINETEVITINSSPAAKTAAFSDIVTMELTSIDTKSDSSSTDAVATASEEVKVEEKIAPVIVKPTPRARK